MSATDSAAVSATAEIAASGRRRLRIAIAIATAGRVELLPLIAPHWIHQTRPADTILVVGAEQTDVGALAQSFPELDVIIAPRKGLPNQRNGALDRLGNTIDLVVFFDDDYVPSRTFLETLEGLVIAHPDLAMITGRVLSDGIMGPGISYEAGRDLVAAYDAAHPEAAQRFSLKLRRNAYGCNMVANIALSPQTRFDPALPLYAWLEDVDYSVRMRAFGRSVECFELVGVHLGVKVGRTPGRRIGYAQIANPIYLHKKGSLSRFDAFELAARNCAKNLFLSAFPEPWFDRFGRLQGNLIGLGDWFCGKLHPQRMLDL
jgi:hypothetical protein